MFLLRVSVLSAEDKNISIQVRIEGFSNDKGLCRLLIYQDKKGFPESVSEAVSSYTNPINTKTAEFFLKLMPGNYAFSVLHDANANGKMDKTWYGKPVEGFGASNNPVKKKGPPAFEECVLSISNNSNTLFIRIQYL